MLSYCIGITAKFNNGVQKDADGKNIKVNGKMIKNWFEWSKDKAKEYQKIHPAQKPVGVLKELIKDIYRRGRCRY